MKVKITYSFLKYINLRIKCKYIKPIEIIGIKKNKLQLLHFVDLICIFDSKYFLWLLLLQTNVLTVMLVFQSVQTMQYTNQIANGLILMKLLLVVWLLFQVLEKK